MYGYDIRTAAEVDRDEELATTVMETIGDTPFAVVMEREHGDEVPTPRIIVINDDRLAARIADLLNEPEWPEG